MGFSGHGDFDGGHLNFCHGGRRYLDSRNLVRSRWRWNPVDTRYLLSLDRRNRDRCDRGLIELIHESHRLANLGSIISQNHAGDKKECSQYGCGARKEISRTARPKNRGRGTAAKGRAHVGTLAVLDKDQTNQAKGQKEMDDCKNSLHLGIKRYRERPGRCRENHSPPRRHPR